MKLIVLAIAILVLAATPATSQNGSDVTLVGAQPLGGTMDGRNLVFACEAGCTVHLAGHFHIISDVDGGMILKSFGR